MLRTVFLTAITTGSLAACNHLPTNKVAKALTENTGTKQDSSCGYSPANGISMYYEIHGQGATLVLIHGGGSTIQTSFGRILPNLAKGRKVLAIELQGHGHTLDRNTPETFEQDADDVAAVLHHLKIEKADFFGFSNGGKR